MPEPTATTTSEGKPRTRVNYKDDPNKKRAMELKVWQLRVRRFTWPEIGAALSIPRTTAQYLFCEFERRNDHEWKDLAAKSIGDRLIAAAEQRLHTLDALYRDTKNDNVKLGAINSMRAEYVHIYETARGLGLIQGAPPTEELKGFSELVDAIRSLAPSSRILEYANRIRSFVSSA